MEWQDDAIILSARKHGETSAIVNVMTRAHGRHAGLVRGASGKQTRGLYQPGNRVEARWRGRLAEHLGTLTCEMTTAVAAALLDDPLRLAALSAACAVTEAALPERQTHAPVFEGLSVLLAALEGDSWPSVYVKWELGLLQELGFGLDLSCCAATGATEDLSHVSPKTGRAVSRQAAEPYLKVLLALPPFLLESGREGDAAAVADGLRLTGYFLTRHVFAHPGGDAPAARNRLVERLRAQRPN